MRNARPFLLVLVVMIVFWMILASIWPTAVLYYFAIVGGLLALFALGHDVKRTLESIGGRDGRRHRNT